MFIFYQYSIITNSYLNHALDQLYGELHGFKRTPSPLLFRRIQHLLKKIKLLWINNYNVKCTDKILL